MNFIISRESGETVYHQIGNALRREINERFQPGDRLPTEPQMAERFSVNRHTIRKAVDVLVAEGLVQRQHGSGTFVTSQPIDYPIAKGTRFTENLSKKNILTKSRLLKKIVLPARGGVADKLGLKPETRVIWLETLRMVEGQPFCIISHFLPFDELEFVMDAFEGGSLHKLLMDRNIIPIRRLSLVTSMLPVGEDAKYLQMPTNQPVLRVKSVNVSEATHKAVEYAVTRFRADRVQLNIAIS